MSRIRCRVNRGRVHVREIPDGYESGHMSGGQFDIELTQNGDELRVIVHNHRYGDVAATVFFEGDIREYGPVLYQKMRDGVVTEGEVDSGAVQTLIRYMIEEAAGDFQD